MPARMAVVYCPRTHAWFGHPPYPLEKMLAAGVPVALGTDSRASSPDLSLLAEMRARRPAASGRSPPASRACNWARCGAAAALGRRGDGQPGAGQAAPIWPWWPCPIDDAADPYELLFDSDAPVVQNVLSGSDRRMKQLTPAIGLLVSDRPDGRRQDGRGRGTGPANRGRNRARWIRWRCIAAWTSAPPSRRPEERAGRAASPDRRLRAARRLQPGPAISKRPAGRGRDPRPRAGSAVRRRDAALSERAAARHFSRARPPTGNSAVNLKRRPAAAAPSGSIAGWPRSTRPRPRGCIPTTRGGCPALEVYEKTGQPISQLQRQFEHGRPADRMPRLRARLAAGGAGRADRRARGGDVRRRTGRRGSPAALAGPLPPEQDRPAGRRLSRGDRALAGRRGTWRKRSNW